MTGARPAPGAVVVPAGPIERRGQALGLHRAARTDSPGWFQVATLARASVDVPQATAGSLLVPPRPAGELGHEAGQVDQVGRVAHEARVAGVLTEVELTPLERHGGESRLRWWTPPGADR